MHIEVAISSTPSQQERAPLVVVYAPAGPATDAEARERISAACSMANSAGDAGRDVVVVACCHPRDGAALFGGLTGRVAALSVWDAQRPMLEAAARALVSSGR